MSRTTRERRFARWTRVTAWLCALGLSAGCAPSRALTPPENSDVTVVTTPDGPQTMPVVRYGRYRLVELGPGDAQRDLMQQIIDLAIPVSATPTVGDAVQYVLRHSGYQSCPEGGDVNALYSLPLPAADMHLGPMTLRDALQVLGGPVWQLHVDEVSREVCFVRVPATESAPGGATSPAQRPDGSVPATSVEPATSFPVPSPSPGGKP